MPVYLHWTMLALLISFKYSQTVSQTSNNYLELDTYYLDVVYIERQNTMWDTSWFVALYFGMIDYWIEVCETAFSSMLKAYFYDDITKYLCNFCILLSFTFFPSFQNTFFLEKSGNEDGKQRQTEQTLCLTSSPVSWCSSNGAWSASGSAQLGSCSKGFLIRSIFHHHREMCDCI